MFDDQQQSSQTQDNTQQPAFGLGSNPSAGFGAPDPQAQDSPAANSYVVHPDASQAQSHANPQEDVSAEPVAAAQPVAQPTDDNAAQTTQASATDSTTDSTANGLDDIKRQALAQLSPLVHQLNQSAEEKYKTLMMMIQASDNQELLGEAYQAAQSIEDEKVRAEALLNIVNEINYFTQQQASQ